MIDLAPELGEPLMMLTYEELKRLQQPIVYVWTPSEEVLYVGMSFVGLQRPIGTHEKLRAFQLGDLLTIWPVANPYAVETILIHRLVPRLNGATHCSECRRRHERANANVNGGDGH